MARKPKYSKEVKVQACKDYQAGNASFKSIAKSIGANYETVRRWYLGYQEHGHNVFETSDQNQSYNKKFKLSVIEEYITGKHSISGLAAKYNITYSVVRKWINNKYNKRGPKPKSEVDESNLTEIQKLKLELEKEKH